MVEILQQQGTLFVVGFSFFCVTSIIGLNRLQRSLPSPVNKALVRWLRLIAISFFLGFVIKFTFLENVSFWRLFVIGFLIWGLLETSYIWLYIVAWDKSELPLFPRIRDVESIDWPANKRFFYIKDWIRQNGYEEIASLKYYYENEVLQSSVIYQSPDKIIRLQVLIVADATGVILDQVAFASEDVDGHRYITDNIFMPYGGFYPEKWKIKRLPFIRRIDALAKVHSNQLAGSSSACIQIDSDPVKWTEESQQLLEEVNVQNGILNERSNRNDYGKMTGEGRYRIWKELLLLNYFCRS